MHLFRVRDEYADPKYDALEELAEMPFTSHNDAKLLINGREAFPAIFAGMEAAENYIIVQFYIIRDDTLGRQLKELLERKSREGVRVYVLLRRNRQLRSAARLSARADRSGARSSCRFAHRAACAIASKSTFAIIARS